MKILVAIEDQRFGQAIGDFICEHQWPEDTEIRLVHAVEPINVYAFSGYPSQLITDFQEERVRAGKSLLLRIGTQIAKNLPSVPIKETVYDGSPKELIIRLAREWPADLIVVGSHGRTGIGQFVLGSVSMSVLSAAPCSVMVVKLPKEAQKETMPEKETVEAK